MKDQSLEQTNQMGRFSQPPRPECCSGEGQARDPEMRSVTERPLRSVHKDKHGPQGGVATSLSNPASKLLDAGGDGVQSPQPNMKETVKGKVSDSLPGSKSVARVESDDRNLGDPETLRRTNYGNQAGRGDQRQEDRPENDPGVRSVHSSSQQGPRGPEASEGADNATQPAKETKAVRTTEGTWQTSLKAIANKAAQAPHHRFGGLYRLLNEDNLRECFMALRRDAAPGVDGVSFQE